LKLHSANLLYNESGERFEFSPNDLRTAAPANGLPGDLIRSTQGKLKMISAAKQLKDLPATSVVHLKVVKGTLAGEQTILPGLLRLDRQ
jgi:plasmid maintenance system killer protein